MRVVCLSLSRIPPTVEEIKLAAKYERYIRKYKIIHGSNCRTKTKFPVGFQRY